MSDFDDFVKSVKAGAKELAKQNFDGFEDEALKDTASFLRKSKSDLQRWTRLLAEGAITEEDFDDLVRAKKAISELAALRQTGLTLIKIQRFRDGLFDLVVDSAFTTFL